jgi:hypothetical protein
MKGQLIFIFMTFFAVSAVAETFSSLPDPTRPDGVATSKSKLIPKDKRRREGKRMFSLQQTIVSPNRKTATINGRVLSIGDEVDGATVISISNNKAYLQWRREIIELNLITQGGIKEANR